jgi:hypothetical protein
MDKCEVCVKINHCAHAKEGLGNSLSQHYVHTYVHMYIPSHGHNHDERLKDERGFL